jgi:integrase-like protein
MKLWPRALPRPLRFHDLRHSTATILLANGTPPHVVRRIPRHASVATTTAIYGHLQAEDVRAAVNAIAPPSKTPVRVTGESQARPARKERRPGSQLSLGIPGPGEWALLVSNQRPPPCEDGALPLS